MRSHTKYNIGTFACGIGMILTGPPTMGLSLLVLIPLALGSHVKAYEAKTGEEWEPFFMRGDGDPDAPWYTKLSSDSESAPWYRKSLRAMWRDR